ncbi:MAG: beta-carotene hydroxylase [Bacteroidetes bacterium]|nr:MAG: beta-carotene hydroxylase [Bacteroidota bacterium]MBL1143779.1 beta-carotene hydroxylase [Bacteroidota bacterium]MCB0802629.1 sterol desaturase family protein [Flavobacteriales bacterium]NOG56580.1 beta-carotene hydroxylase [Bacteroidota bacterium]
MNIAIHILITLLTFCFMEFMAWFSHKYIMHGFLWKLHKDHHQPEKGWFEKNDTFFLFYALISTGLFWSWSEGFFQYGLAIGLGILLYGMAYFAVHDIFIHQRFSWLRRTDNIYFRAIRKAHKVHHKHLGKEKGECFGMLLVPFKYFKEAAKTNT